MSNLKLEVIKYAKKLNDTNLSPLRSGNVSVRTDLSGKEGFFITPSGVKYNDLQEDKIVFLEMDEKKNEQKIVDHGLNPSSEWKFHQDIYINKPNAIAIVHAHSPYATAVSAHGKNIPAFHYMVALAGGNDIKCADYATFGTKQLSKNIIQALNERKGCLMSNHGQVAFGSTLKQAFELAEEVENICHQYIIALKIGNPKILSWAEMNKILDKIKHYKKA